MPNGPRIRANNVYGVVSDNPLTAASSTFNSVSLPLLPVVSSAHAVVVLDPKRVYGDPEIVVVTVHTVGSTVATILRGQYGTSPRLHPEKTAWAHVPIDEDYTEIVTSTTRPGDPYRGQSVFDYDTNRYIGRSTADVWQQMGLFFDPPTCRVTHSVAQSTTNNVEFNVLFDTEEYDTDNMHSTTVNPGRITFNTPGIYIVGCTFEFPTHGVGYRYGVIRNQAGSALALKSDDSESVLSGWGCNLVITKKFVAGDWVTVHGLQNCGGALNISKAENFSPMFFATWIGRGN